MTVPSRSCETSESFSVEYSFPASDSCLALLKKYSLGAYAGSYLCG